jgi:hypothetical protein
MRNVFAALACFALDVFPGSRLRARRPRFPSSSRFTAIHRAASCSATALSLRSRRSSLRMETFYGVTLFGGQGSNAGGTVWQVNTAAENYRGAHVQAQRSGQVC